MTDSSRKEYQRQWLANKRKIVDNEPKPVDKPPKVSTASPRVDKSIFAGKGRGVPVSGHVLIAGGSAEDYVVTEPTWRKRLESGCKHAAGWSCKLC